MNKYIDTEKLIAGIKQLKEANKVSTKRVSKYVQGGIYGFDLAVEKILTIITSLQQEQPLEGKQVVIITETDGDANIHWDCRSLGDVKALLASAQSFIVDKQVEELRGQGSEPDYNTTEGRYSHLFKHQQEQSEVDLEKVYDAYCKVCGHYHHTTPTYICRHACDYFDEFKALLSTRKKK